MDLLSESDRERRKELRRIIDAWGTPRAYDKAVSYTHLRAHET